MELHGRQLIGNETSQSGSEGFQACDPRNAGALQPQFRDASAAEIERALELAGRAHPHFELAGREKRAALLESIAGAIEALGPGLLERASLETGLPLPRLESERGRTCGQLRLFAKVVREGAYLDVRIDRADKERKPLPKPDLRSMQRALGPVVVFGASNFPLAFSVAGGDTVSALAAGCPVVVKAHPNHPGTSELVGRAIVDAIRAAGLPAGVFSLLHGRGNRVGAELVRHPATRAVGFTGSLRGGRALFDLAAARPEPIPVYAEMGSTNPVFILPARLAADTSELALALANSVTLGAGQFCTNPGLVVVPKGKGADAFVAALAAALREKPEAPMLHAGIRAGFDARLGELAAAQGVERIERGAPAGPCGARAALFSTDAARFLANPMLQEEVFGPCTLVVRCESAEGQLELARRMHGQLTATIHAAEADLALARSLATLLEQKAGRVLFGGFPTGVEVSPAMVHGGPYPATTDSRSTSVGTAAIARFTRPVCYQDFPEELLPGELRGAGAS